MVTAIAIDREALKTAIREEFLEAVRFRRHWHCVSVWPDGNVTHGAYADKCWPAPEFLGDESAPLTVWSMQGINAPAADLVYEWEECKRSEADFFVDSHGYTSDYLDDRHNLPRRLSDIMIDDLDWDTILPPIEKRMAEAGYTLDA